MPIVHPDYQEFWDNASEAYRRQILAHPQYGYLFQGSLYEIKMFIY